MDFDCIVVGSGIAGLSFALKVAKRGHKVGIITKKRRADSNTNYAQGGIACVTSGKDDVALHVKDTLTAGDGLCRESAVQHILSDGPERIQELIDMGVAFTQLEDGRPSLGKEGGHSKRRILHVKDLTGAAIERALLAAIESHENIVTMEHYFAIDLITESRLKESSSQTAENRVHGLYVYDVKQQCVRTMHAPAVMLSTGGVGHVYQYTTNPDIATGDGIAMAYRAGVSVANMEFVQFHPTAFYTSNDADRFLISEVVRGEGARLRNSQGELFMKAYDVREELAPRDIVARAIDSEMKSSGSPHVWLDLTMHDAATLKERFPHIYDTCLKKGIEISKDWIPVVPAAHYMCGGVVCDVDSRTSLLGLYTCGEVACTGLHGANRLASNSLLEAVVMAHRGAHAVDTYLASISKRPKALPDWADGDVHDSDERVVLSHNLRELKHTMWDYVGIVRTTKRLERARTRIANLKNEINEYYWDFKVDLPLLELRNLVQCAELIVNCALMRKESRGLHYNADCLDKLDAPKDSKVRLNDADT